MPQSPVRSGLNARKGPVLASANDDQEASTKGIKLVGGPAKSRQHPATLEPWTQTCPHICGAAPPQAARGGASSPGRGVPSTARGKVAVYDMAVGLLTLVALAGSYTLLGEQLPGRLTCGATQTLG